MAGPRWTWVEYTLLKIFKSFVSNSQRMEQVVSRRAAKQLRQTRRTSRRKSSFCDWMCLTSHPKSRRFALPMIILLTPTPPLCYVVLSSLQKRPFSWCWNRRKCAREENCLCNRWWKLNEAIVFVSIIILLNYMILALVWCFNAPSLNICLFISLLFFPFDNIFKVSSLSVFWHPLAILNY